MKHLEQEICSRLTQELISKYFMEEMVYGCLVKGRTKYKSQANNFLKNNI